MYILCFVGSSTLASSQKPQKCFTLNEILETLPTYPEQLFFQGDKLRVFLTGEMGITSLSAAELKALETLLLGQGETVGRTRVEKVDPLHGLTPEEPRDAELKHVWTRRRLELASSQIQGWFLKQEGPSANPHTSNDRLGFHSIHDMHNMPLPNREALAEYWARQDRDAQSLAGITVLNTEPGKKAARLIRFPKLIAKELSPEFAKKHGYEDLPDRTFALDSLTYIEEGITPERFSSIRVDAETSIFPVRMKTVKSKGKDLYIPYPFPAQRPIRQLEMTQATLRAWKVNQGGLEETIYVPRAKWTIGFNQSYEDAHLRLFRHVKSKAKGAPEDVFWDRDGKTPSPFGIPRSALYKLSFYETDAVPRETFTVRFGRKTPLDEMPIHTPELKELMDHFMSSPSDLLYSPGSLSHNGLSSSFLLSGRIPTSSHTEMVFHVLVNTRDKSYVIQKAEERTTLKQHVMAFRDSDFDAKRTAWFSHRYVYLSQAVVGLKGEADVVLRMSDVRLEGEDPAKEAQWKQAYPPVLTEERDRSGAIRGYISKYLPQFRGFKQKEI
jgi:hypothetical protein